MLRFTSEELRDPAAVLELITQTLTAALADAKQRAAAIAEAARWR